MQKENGNNYLGFRIQGVYVDFIVIYPKLLFYLLKGDLRGTVSLKHE